MHVTKLFLLGGYDLEMLTIKQILEGKEDCMVQDRHLHWENALLSAYNDALQQYKDVDVYGIELREDVPIPPNYHRIDHHNEWYRKPCALEQVAEILGLTLNRYQQLVAANDKGYIPAMQQLYATEEEIADIRKRDRAAQGVTAEEEVLGVKAISENLEKHGVLTIVKALTSRFSPICDRLFPYQRLLIYTDSEWMYYGEGKAELVKQFASEIEQKKVFYGGGVNGYIGSVRHAFCKEDIRRFVKDIRRDYGYN